MDTGPGEGADGERGLARSDGSAGETVLPDGGSDAGDEPSFFEALVANSDAGLLAVDAGGAVVYANEAVATILGAETASLVGTDVVETGLVDADSGEAWVAALDGETTFQRTIERDPDGEPLLDGGSPAPRPTGSADRDAGSADADSSDAEPSVDDASDEASPEDEPTRPISDWGVPSVDTAEAREVAVEVTAEPLAVGGERHALLTCRDVSRRMLFERESNILSAIFEHIPIYLYVKDERGRHVRVSDFNEEAVEYIGKTDVDIWGEGGRESYEEDMRVIEEGERVIQREEFQPDWNQFFLSSKVPWRGEDGEIKGLIGITNDLSDWKQKEKQLERQNERLRTVASVISHDIRNPLQVAKGRLDMATDEYDSENLDSAADALDRMAELLEELLGLVRHGQWVDEPETVSLQSLAEGCWDTATGEGGTLEFKYDLNLAADPGRLQQLLENLFRNAVVHGGDDVRVYVSPLDDWSGFYVEDDGPGIPPDEREKIFESGYTTSDEGTGFGLAIVQVIAEAHGWHVRVTEGDDGGARFEFRGVEFV